MKIENVDLGISSEGSFGSHPSIPFVQGNLELLLFIGKKNGFEILGHHRTPETNIDGRYVTTVEEALDFAKKIGFPKHGVIVRKSKNGHFGIYKDITTEKHLIKTVKKLLNNLFTNLFTNRIFIESDMRAHRNPTRMKAIKKATKDLIKNIKSLCPRCKAPGFIVVDFKKGIRCSWCNSPTDLPIYDIYKCSVCNYEEKRHNKMIKLLILNTVNIVIPKLNKQKCKNLSLH